MQGKNFRIASIAGVSVLALAALSNASAAEFKVGDTNLSVYGYVILKAAYDLDEDLGSANAADFSSIGASTVDGHVDFDSRQSRLGVTTSTATSAGELKTVFEGDMNPYNTTGFRLRHAYGEWNGILAGRAWSNYTSFVGYTTTVDFDANVGLAGLQAPREQIRYTTGNFSASLENPSFSLASPDPVEEHRQFPSLTLRYESGVGPLFYAFGAMAHQLSYDTGSASDSATGVGAFTALTYHLGPVSLNGTVNYSDGNSANLYLAPGPDGFVGADGSIQKIKGWGGSAGVSAQVGPGTFNLAYGYVENTLDDSSEQEAFFAGDQQKRQNAFVNYFWSPMERVTYAVEYGYYKAETTSGDSGSANRIAFAARYDF